MTNPDTFIDIDRLNREARQTHQLNLLADIDKQNRRWADRIHTRRQLGVAALVLVLLFVTTPTIMAQHLPAIPVSPASPAQQQHALALANDIIALV